ncbi:MAG: PAS domain S-box protein [Cyclobacteriaceae bacterium]|nr:PAS domain S-box protein [Cyclobacteriaceae bacterium]
MKKAFPIIGIGASAGGLEPLEIFFEHVALDTKFAYVIIQHLAPNHKSLMDELLARHTQLPIHIIQDGMKPEEGNIYLNPPKKFVEISQGRFVLSEKEDRKLSFPISNFFHSLSGEFQENACAVILSGTGSDGTDGIKFIKEKGGFVLVQDPDEAKFNGMPINAINTGSVDKVCGIESMHQEIDIFFKNKQQFEQNQMSSGSVNELITKILKRTQQLIDVDFTGYKHTTVSRRIGRRISLLNFGNMEEYYQHLANNPAEANFLSKELMIGVTRFFRDEEAFEALKHKVIPQLIAQNMDTKTIRIWVPACSTGEEAYSIAILLKDHLRKNKMQYNVSIFATDLDKEAIKFAGNRIFTESISAEVPPEFFNTYFIAQRSGYAIAKEIREMIVFSCHNLIQDPPFNKIDLISCRNFLIYLNEPVQQHLFSLFQYSLKSEGFLFLGSSETLGTAYDEFLEIDKKYKIYSNKENKKFIQRPKLGISNRPGGNNLNTQILYNPVSQKKNQVLNEIQHALIQEYVPDTMVIDEHFNLLHTTGNTHRWLSLPSGEVSANVLKMMPESLSMPIEVVGIKVLNEAKPVTLTDIQIPPALKPFYGSEALLQIHIRSKKLDIHTQYLFLTFESKGGKNREEGFETINISEASNDHIHILERELRINRETLQTTIEELESSNEELQAANEELQSSNEELESVNEELYTVNSEYQEKNTELAQTNDDLNNLIQSTEIAILFLDSQLNIRRYTPTIRKIMDLMPHDIGRNVSHFRGKIQLENFMEHVETVLEKLMPYETNVKDVKGKEYLLRISPFRTSRNEIKGVILVFVDLTQAKKIRKEIQLSDNALSDLKSRHADQKEILELISENINDMVFIIDQNGKIEYCTPSTSILTGYAHEELLQMNLFSRIPDAKQTNELKKAIAGFLNNQQSGLIEFEFQLNEGKKHWFEANLKPINKIKTKDYKILMTVRDVQERSIREEEYQRNSLIAEQTSSAVIITDKDGRIAFTNNAFEKMTGYMEEEVLGKKPGEILQGEESDPEIIHKMSMSIKSRKGFDVNIINYTKQGYKYITNIKTEPLFDKFDDFIGFFSIQNDITREQEQLNQIQILNQKIKDQNNKLTEANKALEEFAYVASHDLKTPVRNIKGLLEIIDMKGDSLDIHRRKEILKIVISSALELDKMIKNLLEYSRTGIEQEEREMIDTDSIIKDVLQLFNNDLTNSDGKIILEIKVKRIYIYPILFKRLLTNLISNAIKYKGNDPPEIKISCLQDMERIIFNIKDNGIGIPENQHENIFKIFRTLGKNKDSNGIGLSVCKKIVELHGGEIGLQSIPGQGSTFHFTISNTN